MLFHFSSFYNSDNLEASQYLMEVSFKALWLQGMWSCAISSFFFGFFFCLFICLLFSRFCMLLWIEYLHDYSKLCGNNSVNFALQLIILWCVAVLIIVPCHCCQLTDLFAKMFTAVCFVAVQSWQRLYLDKEQEMFHFLWPPFLSYLKYKDLWWFSPQISCTVFGFSLL